MEKTSIKWRVKQPLWLASIRSPPPLYAVDDDDDDDDDDEDICTYTFESLTITESVRCNRTLEYEFQSVKTDKKMYVVKFTKKNHI